MTGRPLPNPIPADMRRRCTRAFERGHKAWAQHPQIESPARGLRLLRHHARTAFEATIYKPVICLIVRGAKETTFGGQSFALAAGQCLLISHDLPVVSRITEAPYVALLLDIDVDTLRSLYEELGQATLDSPNARALEVRAVEPPLLDALGRYLALEDSPVDARVLGPMIAKEIHYRLLMAPWGGMLRRLIQYDSHASAVARAISRIRRDFRSPLVVAELAREVGMSVSAFHRHFKAVTSLSPLQYQKDLRLLEARRRLAAGTAVSTAAHDVGYESPNQFSREYARKFGGPPKRDLQKKPSDQRIVMGLELAP